MQFYFQLPMEVNKISICIVVYIYLNSEHSIPEFYLPTSFGMVVHSFIRPNCELNYYFTIGSIASII